MNSQIFMNSQMPHLEKYNVDSKQRDYTNTIAASSRLGISSRALCAVANVSLADMEIE